MVITKTFQPSTLDRDKVPFRFMVEWVKLSYVRLQLHILSDIILDWWVHLKICAWTVKKFWSKLQIFIQKIPIWDSNTHAFFPLFKWNWFSQIKLGFSVILELANNIRLKGRLRANWDHTPKWLCPKRKVFRLLKSVLKS